LLVAGHDPVSFAALARQANKPDHRNRNDEGGACVSSGLLVQGNTLTAFADGVEMKLRPHVSGVRRVSGNGG